MVKAQTLSWDEGIPLAVIRTTLCRVNWHSSMPLPWVDPPQNYKVSWTCFQCLSASFFLAPHLSVTPSQVLRAFPGQSAQNAAHWVALFTAAWTSPTPSSILCLALKAPLHLFHYLLINAEVLGIKVCWFRCLFTENLRMSKVLTLWEGT